jgi:hypothetical protein
VPQRSKKQYRQLVKTESTHRSQNRNRRRSGIEIFLSFRKWQPLLAYAYWRGCRLHGRELNQHTSSERSSSRRMEWRITPK